MSNGGTGQLTDREKRVLRLLASGHSVKSAAAEEGITENAANELLRSARRKLGTGSSREAARLLAEHEGGTQKIRDEKSGIPLSAAEERSRSRFNKGIVAMIVTALAASAAFMMLGTQGGSSAGRDGPAPPGGGSGGTPGAVPAQGGSTAALPPNTQAPRVIRTVPAEGAVIGPGPFQLSVTFDRPMAPGSYAFSHDRAEAAPPDCSAQPQLSLDGRTYTLNCIARHGARYVTYFNRPPHIGFLDAATRTPAEPARLEFRVSGEPDETASSPAKVVRTVPADGAEIPAGPFTVSVTFDRPMAPQSYSFVRSDEGIFPNCTGTPRLSADGMTYSWDCTASEPGKYVMYFNRPPYLSFREAGTQVPAEPARLEFTVHRP